MDDKTTDNGELCGDLGDLIPRSIMESRAAH